MARKKAIVTVAATTALAVSLTGVGMSAASAQVAPPSSAVQPVAAGTYGGLTADQWRQVAASATAAGDTSGAQAANQAARSIGGGSGTVTPQAAGVLWTVAKKAIKTVLVQGRHLMPAKIRPYADKIVDVIDAMDDFSESVLIIGLQSAGVPYDVARGISQWVVTFLL